MTRPKRKLQASALDFVEDIVVLPRALDLLEELREDRASASPIRAGLEKRSDFDFAASLVGQLADAGVDSRLTGPLVLQLILYPTVSLATVESDGSERVLQAIVVSRNDALGGITENGEVRMTLKGRLVRGRPPQLTDIELTLDLYDVLDETDCARIILELTSWLEDYPGPYAAASAALGTLTFLGTPRPSPVATREERWEQGIAAIAAAFGLKPRIQTTQQDVQLPPSNSHVFLADPSFVGVAKARGIEMERITLLSTPYEDFTELKIEVIRRLLIAMVREDEPGETVSRSLSAGERVFHKKIGKSMKFDFFDQGSASPCLHGEAGFVRFNGPKSRKGMLRRYDNFDNEMLYHCGKYPNCGMYAVFG